jgi:hypothetical protein
LGQRAVLLLTPRAFEPFLGVQTSALRGLTSVFSRLTLLCSSIASSGLLVPLGMRISEGRAVFKHVGGSRQGR